MKLLIIGNDRNLFDPESAVYARVVEQSKLVAQMHIVVFTPKGKNFEVIHVGKKLSIYPTSSTGKWAYLPDAYRVAKKILGKMSVKEKWVVSVQDPFEVGVIGYLISRKFSIPLHVQLHTDPFSHEWRVERKLNSLRYFLAAFLLSRADEIRVVSERVSRAIEKLGIDRSRITKVPIFVDVNHFSNTEPSFNLHHTYKEFSHIILSMGRLQPEKNYRQLIRAFAQVNKIYKDTLLLIVGNGPERERLLSIARSLDIEKSVSILPWARDVVSYYKTCDIYVQPSLYEGWGLAVIEALASGAPVIMSDVGCAGEIVRNEETGIIVPPKDEQSLVRGIERLLSNDSLRTTIALNGAKEVKKLASQPETLMLYKKSWEKALKHAENKKQ